MIVDADARLPVTSNLPSWPFLLLESMSPLELARRLMIREGGVGMYFDNLEKACPAGVQLDVAPGEWGEVALEEWREAGGGMGKVTSGRLGILLPFGKAEGAASLVAVDVLGLVAVVADRIGGDWRRGFG